MLMNKRKEIGLPGSGPSKRLFYPRNPNARKKAPKVENTYLKESLVNNPHYMVRQNFAGSGDVYDSESGLNDSLMQ
jgi:hypothetical protein